MDFSDFKLHIIEFGIKAIQLIENLTNFLATSANAAILNDKGAMWATLVTDIITIAAALGALALPISLNVIETTRTRYRSPSLLKITSSLSGIDAKKLNRHLFITLAIAIIAKLLISTQSFNLTSLVPYLITLTIWFGYVVRQVYIHLKFTYTFMSNVEIIHEYIYQSISKHARSSFLPNKNNISPSRLSKIKILNLNKINIEDTIKAFIELESYLLCSSPTKTDFDIRIRKLSHIAVKKLENNNANEFIRHLLASLPNVLAAVEVSREVDVYQSISDFYLSLAMTAILGSDEYRSQIGIIERIARFRENKLPSYGRFCRNGRLFLSFAHKPKPGNEAYQYLQAHFERLIETSVRDQPENIPELLNNVRQVIQYKGNYNKGAWDIPEKVSELWGYSSMPEFDRDVAETYSGRLSIAELEQKIENKFKPEMQLFIKQKTSEEMVVEEKLKLINHTVDNIWQGIELNRFSSNVETATLRALATLLAINPEIFVECRELRNPAGSNSFNVGHSPVPSSLTECVEAFLAEPNFSDYHTIRNGLQEYKVVDAIGALIVYEFWSIFIIGATGATIKPELSVPAIPSCQLRELKSASSRITLLKTSLLKALINTRFIERLGLLPDHITTLQTYAIEFCDLLSGAIKEKTKSQITNQKLDPASLDRFKSEVTEKLGSSIRNYELFKRITIGEVPPIISNISLPREAFLAGNDTYYLFDTYGFNFAQEIHNWLSAQILFHNNKTENAELTLPVRNAEWMICSASALKKFLSVGFTTSGRKLTWPDGNGCMKYFEINCAGSGYYMVFPSESLITASYAHRENELPLNISYTDNGESVNFKIEYYIGARK